MGLRGWLRALVAAAALLIWLVGPGAVQARETFDVEKLFKPAAGTFGALGPGQMAIHEASNTLYVVDASNHRILKFDITDPLNPVASNFSALTDNAITQAAGANLDLVEWSDIAVDNSGGAQDGTLYLATNTAGGTSRAYAYAPTGQFRYQFGLTGAGASAAFDPAGTPVQATAIAVSPRDGAVVNLGPNAIGVDTVKGAAWRPSDQAGGLPSLIKTGVGPLSGINLNWRGLSFDPESGEFFGALAGLAMWTFDETFTRVGFSGFNFGIPGYLANQTLEAVSGFERRTFILRQATRLAIHRWNGALAGTTTELLDVFSVDDPPIGSGIVIAPGDRIYVSSRSESGIRIYGRATAPDAEVVTPDSGSETSASLRARVKPQGLTISKCEFEYGTTVNYGTKVPCEAPLPGADADEAEVATAPITVVAGSTYNIRVVVETDEGRATYSSNFTWKAPKLAVASTLAAGPQQADGSALLGGDIDPQGTPTSYFIEYGKAADLTDAERWPAAENVDIGSATPGRPVFQKVEGLEADTTYYFRLVAETAAGAAVGGIESFTTPPAVERDEPSVCENEEFRTGPSASLPGCMAWERATPHEKAGGDVTPAQFAISPDGNRITYNIATYLGGPNHSPVSTYLAQRSESGWESLPVAPPNLEPFSTATHFWTYHWVTPDLRYMFGTQRQVDLPGAPASPNRVLYMRDNDTGQISALQGSTAVSGSQVGPHFMKAGSPDGSLIVYEGAQLPVSEGPQPGSNMQLYWRSNDGKVRLVTAMPSGDGVESTSPAEFIAANKDATKVLWNITSPQGRPNSTELYISELGKPTQWVSQAETGVTQPSSSFVARGLTASSGDLHYVYFASHARLTADSQAVAGSRDLYRFDSETGEIEDLTATAGGGGVEQVLGANADGSVVYFVASTNFDGATGSEAKLYYYTESTGIQFVSGLGNGTFGENSAIVTNDPRLTRVTPDGRYLVFVHKGSSLAGQGPLAGSVYDTANRRLMYRYDRVKDRLDCVSCHPDGRPASADTYLEMPGGFRTDGIPSGVAGDRMLIRNDGAVIFTTRQSLVPEDLNSTWDSYIFDGETRLLTSGRSTHGEWAQNATPDFGTIAVISSERLVPADVDDIEDLYMARTGGGIASQQELPKRPAPGCEGESCRPDTETPADSSLGTTHPHGEQNAKPAVERANLRVARVKAGRRGAGRLIVRVSRGGVVVVRGRDLRPVRHQAKTGGRVSLALSLKPAAKRRLARSGRLRTRAVVTYRPAGAGAQRRAVSLRFSDQAGKGSRGR